MTVYSRQLYSVGLRSRLGRGDLGDWGPSSSCSSKSDVNQTCSASHCIQGTPMPVRATLPTDLQPRH